MWVCDVKVSRNWYYFDVSLIFFTIYKMFGSSSTHEERLMERTIQQIYEGKTLASILTALNWKDRMVVLENE